MLELDKNFSTNVLWHKPNLNIHWMTPIPQKVSCTGYRVGTNRELNCFALK